MTTAEALERLNDAAFELLGFRSLREFATDCHAVIHMSINAQEKTVPGPLDRFGRVQQVNPSRFVMIAVTTTKPPTLKAKMARALGQREHEAEIDWKQISTIQEEERCPLPSREI